MDGKTLLAAGWVTVAVANGVHGATTQDRLLVPEAGDQWELRVIIHSETDAPWLTAAQAITDGLFEEAGIRLTWIQCRSAASDSACDRAPAANELVVRIRRDRVDRASHTCGVALRPRHVIGSHITLFLDCLTEGSKDFRVEEAVVAAFSLAHEIAHLLLPTSAHAASGIMQPRLRPIDWERAARGGLRFLPDERRQMADALRARLSPAK